MTGRDAVVVDAVRTPVGRRGGALAGVHPVDLSAHVLDALVARTGLDPALVDDVIWGCVSQTGEQAVNVGRNALLAAGWPEDVVGVTLDRQCGSSQQAVHFAAAGVIAGQYDVAVAGGVESMTRVPMLCTVTQGPGVPFGPRMLARYDGRLVPQGVSAEIVAERWGLGREQLDELAVRSHARAAAARSTGGFDEELAPVGRARRPTRASGPGARSRRWPRWRRRSARTAWSQPATPPRSPTAPRHCSSPPPRSPPGTAGGRWRDCTRSPRRASTRSPCSRRRSRRPGVSSNGPG